MRKVASLDDKRVREAFSRFPTGVAAIAAMYGGKPQVIVASSFTVGVSLDPPLAGFFVQKTSSTWSTLAQASRLGVSILGAEHASICSQLASYDKEARFNNVRTQATEEGALHITGAPVWFDCSIYAVHSAGDHDAVQLLIHDVHIDKESDPLVFHCSKFTHLTSSAQEIYA